ncbi:MAG: HAMP domain-containing histidine kinase [Planctomycetes bacterium]|nr:HAMP domain-containing histidine kinase [Planctomycetota bacterium]
MFILTLVLPSILLSAFAIQAVEAQRQVVLTERAKGLDVEARERTRGLHEAFLLPVRRAEASVATLASGTMLALVRGIEDQAAREPFLSGALVINSRGRRRYPAQRIGPFTEPWPRRSAVHLGGLCGAVLPKNPGARLVRALTLDPAAAAPALERVIDLGGPATQLSALAELGRLQERYGRSPNVLTGPGFSTRAAEETYARLASYPVHATDLMGRLAAAQGRFRLAFLRRSRGDDAGAEAILVSLLDQLRDSSSLLPPDELTDLGERAAALLGSEARMASARRLSEQRRRTEVLVGRLERLFGDVLGAAARGERGLPRISAPGLRAEQTSELSYVKARLGDEIELLTYGKLPQKGLVALRWDTRALQSNFETRLRSSPWLERLVPWKDGLKSDDTVGRARLVAPFDHLALEVRAREDQVAGVGLPTGNLQLWGIGLALVGIVMGAGLTIWTVRRESKEAQLKSDFVSNVTHELKTPLTSIRMFLETLILGRVDGPEEVDECLAIMDRESQRLTRLIEQLLVFSRIEGRKWRVRFSSEDPAELVREAIKLLADQLHTTPAELGVEVVTAQELGKVPVDRFAVVEALLNLLHNAWKYSPNSDRKIRVLLTNRRRMLEITVEDNGMGVPRPDRRRIFVKFERASNAEKSRVEGSGIGLTLASEIVKAHKGRIKYTPNKPQGSRFSIYLPR